MIWVIDVWASVSSKNIWVNNVSHIGHEYWLWICVLRQTNMTPVVDRPKHENNPEPEININRIPHFKWIQTVQVTL